MNDAPSNFAARRKLIGIILLFAVPVVSAYALYFWAPQDWRPHGRAHNGHLVDPARPLTGISLHTVEGKPREPLLEPRWTLVIIGSSRCEEICVAALHNTRQVRTALGKDTLRTRRLYVATDRVGIEEMQSLVQREHPDLALAVGEGAEVYQLDRFFTVDGRSPLRNANDIYLLDPLGNWLMYYKADDPPRGILKDLKKLLRLSHIG